MEDSTSSEWRRRFVSTLNGNLYPTHGLGPVAEYLGIHAGDKFDYLVSMSSREQALSRRCQSLPKDNPRRRCVPLARHLRTALDQPRPELQCRLRNLLREIQG